MTKKHAYSKCDLSQICIYAGFGLWEFHMIMFMYRTYIFIMCINPLFREEVTAGDLEKFTAKADALKSILPTNMRLVK